MDKAEQLKNSIEFIAAQPTERKSPTGNNTGVENSNPVEFFTEETENIEQEKIQQSGLSDSAIKASGKTGAYILGGTIELTFNVLERIIFINKFSDKEKARLVVLDEIEEKDFTDTDNNLNRKFLAVSKKHENIKDKIPLNAKEMEALENACAEYTRITGKQMNPNLIIGATLVQIFANRAMDIFL